MLGAIAELRAATTYLQGQVPQDRNAGAVAYLRGFARVMGAVMHLRAAQADPARAPLAEFYITRLLPETTGLFAQARAGAGGIYALGVDALSG